MTDPDPTTRNVAQDSAHVGVQAAVVHGGVNFYEYSAGDPPEKKFEAGVRRLYGGMLGEARRLIEEAIMGKYINDEVHFYWLLAILSGRTMNELSKEEIARFRGAPSLFPSLGNNAWADGVRTIRGLLESAERFEADIRVPLKELDQLNDPQRNLIIKHTEEFLDGPLRDEMWKRTLEQAFQGQGARNRAARVWKFFQPDPQPPRMRRPPPSMISFATRAQAMAATMIFLVSAGNIGYLLIRASAATGCLGYLLSIVGGYFGVRGGVEWRFRVVRCRAKDQEYRASSRRASSAPPDGFARSVDRCFDYYFAKYAPREAKRAFAAETEGFRRSLREETVEIYREQRIGVERISWLIRYFARDVGRRWQNGTLWSYREELATPLSMRVMTVLGAAALGGGTIWAVSGAVRASPSSAAYSTLFAFLSGWTAARAWLDILLERRRGAADEAEREKVSSARFEEFYRWKARLADRPDDAEMAAWLDCDRKILLHKVFRHYKLTMSDVIAYAFIETPARSTRRARVPKGPWRYTNYMLLLFLLTADGVRQYTVSLAFDQGDFNYPWQRLNYRYEAVASGEVVKKSDDEQSFVLALLNGERIEVQVIGAETGELQQGETPESVSAATLDASGIHHTLHILEGIAAEGREWIKRQYRRR